MQSIKQKFTSRKFIMALTVFLIALANIFFNLNISTEAMSALIASALAFIVPEAYVDSKREDKY